MIKLVVMRHAKSDWNAGAQTDHERPLNERGQREAPEVGRKLAARGFAPDYILSSDSTRTTETFEGMRSSFPDVPIRFARELYHAGLSQVRALADSVPASARTVMVLGHNPGWQDMVAELTGEDLEMKTSCAAVLESDADSLVEALAKGATLKLVAVVTP